MNGKKLLTAAAALLAAGILLFSLLPKGGGAWTDLPEAFYIAHRGIVSADTPENTLQAFREAAKHPAVRGVEFDVWEAVPDGMLLVCHDRDISIQYDAPYGTDIRTVTREDRLRCRNRRNGEPVPTVQEALEAVWQSSADAVPFIELKSPGSSMGAGYVGPDGEAACLSAEALAGLVDFVGAHGTEAYFLSFDYCTVRDAARLAREKGYANVRTMYLDAGYDSTYTDALSGDPGWLPRYLAGDGIDAYAAVCTGIGDRAAVDRFHAAGLLVGAYGVPDIRTARRLAGLGVDFLTPLGVLK